MANVVTMQRLVRMIYAMLTKRERWRGENKTITESKLETLDSD